MRRRGTPGIADVMVRLVGYDTAVTFVRQLRREGFYRCPRVPAERTLRRAELRRLPAKCDVSASAARLRMEPAALRRYLRRRRS